MPMARAATVSQGPACPGSSSGWRSRARSAGAVWANAGAHDSTTGGGPRDRPGPGRGRQRGPADAGRARARLPRQPPEARRPGRPAGDRPRGDLPPRAGVGRRDQGAARGDQALAPGAPAAGHPQRRLVVPQPAAPIGRGADRRGRTEGPPDRRGSRQREARQLPGQRSQGNGERPPPAGRPGQGRGRAADRDRARGGGRLPRRLGRLAAGGRAREPAAAGRRPARRAVGRARRLDRLGLGGWRPPWPRPATRSTGS